MAYTAILSDLFWRRIGLKAIRTIVPALFFLGISLSVPRSSAAEPPTLPAGLMPGESGIVATVPDGETIVLASGQEIRLVGILAPQAPAEGRRSREAALAGDAKAMLSKLALHHTVRLAYGGRQSDRYGRRLAQLYRDDGLWLQGELLARGLARVETYADNRALAAAMLARESEARIAKRGLWASARFAVRRPSEAQRYRDSFELVEGTVDAVSAGRTRRFLKFRQGEAERGSEPGFVAILLPESRRLFKAAGLDPAALAGKRVRVRGIVRWWNGPVIDVSHPEQIEVLTP